MACEELTGWGDSEQWVKNRFIVDSLLIAIKHAQWRSARPGTFRNVAIESRTAAGPWESLEVKP